jgi:hypothetical protein
MMNPTKLSPKAMKAFGTLLRVFRSATTVDVASTIAKAESIPSKNRTIPRRKAQKFDHFIISTAVGYAMKARPTELVFDLARLFLFSKNPTTDHTANPETKLAVLLERMMIILSMMIGFSTLL